MTCFYNSKNQEAKLFNKYDSAVKYVLNVVMFVIEHRVRPPIFVGITCISMESTQLGSSTRIRAGSETDVLPDVGISIRKIFWPSYSSALHAAYGSQPLTALGTDQESRLPDPSRVFIV